MKNLVIVESPTKARTIGKFLGKDYEIRFSMGHIMDLPKSKLGVDVEHDFTPQLEVVEDKKKIITELRSLAKNADLILLATDPDREGEAISSNIQELLEGSGKTKISKDKFKRIVFHEITEGAIKDAINHPREVDAALVNAQVARRVLDRLVGYQLSPLLWKKVRRGLSAGRVQSVALRLIVEREREILNFTKEPYFTIKSMMSQLTPKAPSVEFELIEIDGKKLETTQSFTLYDGVYKITKTVIDTQKTADDLVIHLKEREFFIADVIQKQAKRSPQPPFTTSTLQQDASRRFGYPGKRTMSLAQKLYEEGYITYHRTDSVILSDVAVQSVREFVTKQFGANYIPEKNRVYAGKQKNAQEAHEAIRPTKVTTSVEAVKQDLGPDLGKLYDLIWRRAVASQMSDALTESTTVFADSKPASIISSEMRNPMGSLLNGRDDNKKDNQYRLKTNGSVLVFDGFLKVNAQALADKSLPQFTVNEDLKTQSVIAEPHETPAPPRYNDASLIQTLEEKGIGRPSTYASIISTLTDRAYVDRAERRFQATNIGMAVNDFLVANFSTIDDVPFTAAMEDSLDEVANGKLEWVHMMKDFYKPFSKKLTEVEGADRVKIAVEDTGEICPTCNEGTLVIRTGKFGKFISCSRFPACKFTKPLVEETNVICPKDGGKVIVKKTRKGRKFYGCSNYPNCDFAAWKLDDIKPTPKEKETEAAAAPVTG